MGEIDRINDSSRYLSTLLRNHDDYVDWLWRQKNLYRRYPLTGLYNELRNGLQGVDSFSGLLNSFREFKQRHFLRIGGRDLLGLAGLAETTSQVSDLAGVVLQVGLDVLSQHPEWWAGDDGARAWPRARDEFDLVIMGLGKLGGQELNYVSDIDLIFLKAPKREEQELSDETSALLARLLHTLSHLLADKVNGDWVFNVDLRLRPQGKDGPLVPSASAAAEHYLLHGHPWERQMLLKGRPVAGARSLGTGFLQEVRPFVFRRFLDFQALDELRSMRDQILVEAARLTVGSQQFDVKLGVGGIREVEFLVQSLQLIYGGRQPELDEPNTLRCLDRLCDLGLLSAHVAGELKESYTFLRRVEHWVQLDQNRQTQKLPQSGESLDRLGHSLGFESGEKGFSEALKEHCSIVHRHFLSLFHSGKADGPQPEEGCEETDLSSCYSSESLIRLQSQLGVFPESLKRSVTDILKEFGTLPQRELSEKVLLRLERYFGGVTRRPGLVKVFQSSEPWFDRFCRGLARCEMLSDLLIHHPSLVEGVATASGNCPGSDEWERAGSRLLERSGGYEEGLEWIRRLKNERVLQLTLADLSGELEHTALEEELSALADFVIRATYGQVRENLRLGADLPLAVLAMGKLGSREMSYLSDVDIVFVYDPRPGEQEDQIPPDVLRLVQRFMRMLSTPLQDGPGYAVDARLRPTGNYGPLIVTRKSWESYYEKEADLWEVQALLRVRHVAGNSRLGSWIEERAGEICYRERSSDRVWQRLCHLRERMQKERADERGDTIDLKLGMGGLTDIEFFVQGYQLIEGYKDGSLRKRSVRAALESVLADFSGTGAEVKDVESAFNALRALDHRLRLHTNSSAAKLTPAHFEALLAFGLWPPPKGGHILENWQDVLRWRRNVRAALHCFCGEL